MEKSSHEFFRINSLTDLNVFPIPLLKFWNLENYSPEFSFDVNNLHLLTRFCQWIISESCHNHYQKQPSRGVLTKKCSEIMRQMYRRIAMLKCDLTWVKLHSKCDCKATLFKSYFDMSIPQYICGIFSEELFLRTHLERCFCIIQSWGLDAYLGPCQISVMQFFCKSSKSLKARHTFVSAKSMIN